MQILFECVALYDYKPAIQDGSSKAKLSFAAGEHIGVIFPDDSGWWLAELKGQKGWIPAGYVERPSPSSLFDSKA